MSFATAAAKSRGPQCAGVALGRNDPLGAARVNSAPHHTFGRPMKVGREEIMSMLASRRCMERRDMKAEYATKRVFSHRWPRVLGFES
jgi:seryl-tRNA(Sec) selenium transferase